VTTVSDVENYSWSLNPGRYVGGRRVIAEHVDFTSELERLAGEFQHLSGEAQLLTEAIENTTTQILEGGA